MNQQGVVCDVLDVRLVRHLTVQFFNKSDYPIPGGPALSRIPSVPELNFARQDFLTVLDTFPPVFENSRLEKSVLDSPSPDIPKLLKEIFPLSKTIRQPVVGLPVVPKRKHLLQGSLIREDHENSASKGLVRPSFASLVQSEEVVVWGDFLLFDLGEPLHSGYALHRANEVVNRAYGLQHDDFFGYKVMGFGLESRPSRLQRLLKKRESRRESFCLPFEAWSVKIPATTASSSSRHRLSRIRENQQRTFRHRHLPNSSAWNS